MELARSRILMGEESETPLGPGAVFTEAPGLVTGGNTNWPLPPGTPRASGMAKDGSPRTLLRVQDSPLFEPEPPSLPESGVPWQQEEGVTFAGALDSGTKTENAQQALATHGEKESLRESYHSLPSSIHSSRSPSVRRDFFSISPSSAQSRPGVQRACTESTGSLTSPDRIHVTVIPERQGLIFKHVKFHIQCPQVRSPFLNERSVFAI